MLPAIIACGVSFAGMQFYVSNYMGPELTDILSSLTCIVVMVLVLKFWKPKTIMRLEGDTAGRPRRTKHTGRRDLHGLAAVPAAGGVRAGLGRAGDQARRSTRWTNSLLPSFLPEERRPVLNGLIVPGLHNLITRIPPVTPRRRPTPPSSRSTG